MKRKKKPVSYREHLNEKGAWYLFGYLSDRVFPAPSDSVCEKLKECVELFLNTQPGAFDNAYEAETEAAEKSGRDFDLECALKPLEEKLLTYARDNGYGHFNKNERPMYASSQYVG